MFTFKKYALVGVVALAALSMSCSDDKDDPAPEPPKYNVGAGEAALGGVSNSAYGSSLDIDANHVYMIADLSASVVNEIDLIFDGTNIWTPNTIKTSTDSKAATLKSKYTGSNSTATIFSVPATAATDADLIAAFIASPDGVDLVISDTSVGKKFGILTNSTDQRIALVEVKQKDAASGSILISLLIVD